MFKYLKKKGILMAHPPYWTCPRCGTTNMWCQLSCKECKNRRPC